MELCLCEEFPLVMNTTFPCAVFLCVQSSVAASVALLRSEVEIPLSQFAFPESDR